jgi:hypothetical protein
VCAGAVGWEVALRNTTSKIKPHATNRSVDVLACLALRALLACRALRALLASQEDDGLGGKLAVFREGAGKCLSTAINRTADRVAHWISGHRFIIMPEINAKNYRALGDRGKPLVIVILRGARKKNTDGTSPGGALSLSLSLYLCRSSWRCLCEVLFACCCRGCGCGCVDWRTC